MMLPCKSRKSTPNAFADIIARFSRIFWQTASLIVFRIETCVWEVFTFVFGCVDGWWRIKDVSEHFELWNWWQKLCKSLVNASSVDEIFTVWWIGVKFCMFFYWSSGEIRQMRCSRLQMQNMIEFYMKKYIIYFYQCANFQIIWGLKL